MFPKFTNSYENTNFWKSMKRFCSRNVLLEVALFHCLLSLLIPGNRDSLQTIISLISQIAWLASLQTNYLIPEEAPPVMCHLAKCLASSSIYSPDSPTDTDTIRCNISFPPVLSISQSESRKAPDSSINMPRSTITLRTLTFWQDYRIGGRGNTPHSATESTSLHFVVAVFLIHPKSVPFFAPEVPEFPSYALNNEQRKQLTLLHRKMPGRG